MAFFQSPEFLIERIMEAMRIVFPVMPPISKQLQFAAISLSATSI
jgi:hypothetical protein